MKISEANKLRILYFLVFSCTASWLPIFADFLNDQGLSGVRIGIVLSITPLMMFLIQPFSGMLADKIGYKKSLLIAALLASLSYLFYLVDGTFAYFLIVTLFMSLFYNTLQPVLDSLSLSLSSRDSHFSYGSLRIAGALGWASTGIFVGYGIDAINTTVIFAFSSASMMLTFIFSFLLANGQNQGIVPATTAAAYPSVKKIAGNRALIFLLVAIFLISTGATAIWNFYSIYMKENGASASLVGYGISFQGLCELPMFYFSARIIQRFGIKPTLLITVFATVLRLLLYSVVDNPGAAIFIEVLHGISWSLFWVVCVECVNKLVANEWRATGQSLLYASYFGIGQIAGNFWTGYLYDANLKISEIFLLNAGVVLFVGILIWIFFRDSITEKQTP